MLLLGAVGGREDQPPHPMCRGALVGGGVWPHPLPLT